MFVRIEGERRLELDLVTTFHAARPSLIRSIEPKMRADCHIR
jgi:hypothetical protein